ncbi:MAG: hypothetical protein WC299_05290 [Kiritimatiellia bacterium]
MKTRNILLNAGLIAWLLSGAGGLAEDAKKTEAAPAAGDAEKSGWKLLFSDDFKRNELGKDWVAVDGEWKVENGYMRGSGTLISAKGIPADYPPGYQRLEFEAATDVQPIIFFKDKPKPKVMVGDLSSFIHAQPPDKAKKSPLQTGYFFQFGGLHNTLNQLQRAGASLLKDEDPVHMLVPDQKYRVVLENDKGTVRCIVDGKVIMETKEKQAIFGQDYDRVGFYFYTAAKVFGVKVYVKRLPNDLDLD